MSPHMTTRLTDLGWTVLRFWEHEGVEKIVSTVVIKRTSPHHGPRPLQDV
jgi:very-short-patch-repair endonuclease